MVVIEETPSNVALREFFMKHSEIWQHQYSLNDRGPYPSLVSPPSFFIKAKVPSIFMGLI